MLVPNTWLLMAAVMALKGTELTLYPPLASPVMVRAPAMAEASAAFWHWLRATATMPRSMARATRPIRATVMNATSGSTDPRRWCRLGCHNMLVLSLGGWLVQLASLYVSDLGWVWMVWSSRSSAGVIGQVDTDMAVSGIPHFVLSNPSTQSGQDSRH